MLYHLAARIPVPADPKDDGEVSTNPFSGLKPDFTLLLEGTVKQKWQMGFMVVWAVGIVYLGFKFIGAIIEYANHKGGMHPQQLQEATASMKKTGASMAGLLCLGPILTVIINVFA